MTTKSYIRTLKYVRKTNYRIGETNCTPNGAIYTFNSNYILNHYEYYSSSTYLCLMDDISSINLDTKEDLNLASSNLSI
jgi:CMP-N-acetylneuraminic acid synthetase